MSDEQYVFVVDDDADVRDSMRMLLRAKGYKVRSYASARRFLQDADPKIGCLIADIRMPDMGGLELQEELGARDVVLPVIIITGHGDVPLAVRAMRAGAVDFIEKPFDDGLILKAIEKALEVGSARRSLATEIKAAKALLDQLTPRELSVLDKLVNGCSNKIVAYELGISSRTVEIHRARIMKKLDATSLSELVHIWLAAKRDSMLKV